MSDASASTQPPIAIGATGLGVQYRRYSKQAMSIKTAILSMFKATAYESFWGIRELELTIRKGESVGIIGPNGAGKSTFLKTVAGVLPPTEGNLTIGGRVAPLLELGGGFNLELTGRENIYLSCLLMGLKRKEVDERVDRIIEFSELVEFIDSPIRSYSTGMRSRLGFAIATDVDSEILLLDEVFAVGDEKFRRKATERTESFFEHKRTVVMVSHNLHLVRKHCRRVIFLNKGKVVMDGKPEEVIAAYKKFSKE